MKTHNIRIGGLYLNQEHYNEPSAETVNKPGLSTEVFVNRRTIQGKTSKLGDEIKQKVIQHFKDKYNLNVRLSFDRYCGCSMCPCSPGFNVIAKVEDKPYGKFREESRFDIWAGASEVREYREPKHKYLFNQLLEINKTKLIPNS